MIGTAGRMNKRVLMAAAVLIGVCAGFSASAQSTATAGRKHAPADVAVTLDAEHANPVGGGGNFWLAGGGFEVGENLWHGLGFAVSGSGSHSSSIGPQSIPLSLMSIGVGPRYRFSMPGHLSPKGKASSIFGEFLVGGAKGFNSYFPNPAGPTKSAHSLELQAGGGIDIGLSRLIAIRPVEASWVRMQLPNGTTNVQNDLRLSAGIVFRFD